MIWIFSSFEFYTYDSRKTTSNTYFENKKIIGVFNKNNNKINRARIRILLNCIKYEPFVRVVKNRQLLSRGCLRGKKYAHSIFCV